MGTYTIAQAIFTYKKQLYPSQFIPEGFDVNQDVREGQSIIMSLEAERQDTPANESKKLTEAEPKIRAIIDKIRKLPRTARVVEFEYGIFVRVGRSFHNNAILLCDKTSGHPIRFLSHAQAKEDAERKKYVVLD